MIIVVKGSLSGYSYKLQYKNDKSNCSYFKFVYTFILHTI